MKKNNYEIKYLPSFYIELQEIVNYIVVELKNKEAARRLLNNVEESIINRSNNPECFEIYKSNKRRQYVWYKIYIKNYIVFYTIKDNTMNISHIIYKRRNIKELI